MLTTHSNREQNKMGVKAHCCVQKNRFFLAAELREGCMEEEPLS